MYIEIATRFKPYSHLPGTQVMLPLSTLCFQIYPTMVEVDDLAIGKHRCKFGLSTGGMVDDFTVQQDLERGCIRVWGKCPKGYFRYRLQACETEHKGFVFAWERKPEEIELTKIAAKECNTPHTLLLTRLSFGNTKAQDIEQMCRRSCLSELLPLWFRLGALTPASSAEQPHFLIHRLAEALESNQPQLLATRLIETLRAAFVGLLTPALNDPWHLGLQQPTEPGISPLILLTEGQKIIQRMLVDVTANTIAILPCCPAELHCGRLTGLTIPNYGNLDIEWSKKKIRRMIFETDGQSQPNFKFHSNIKSFRLHSPNSQKAHLLNCGDIVDFSAPGRYLLDRFQ